MHDHVVICNANRKVPGIVEQLLSAHPPVGHIALLIQDATLWQEHPEWRPDLRQGDPRLSIAFGCPSEAEGLSRVSVATARAAVILADPRFDSHGDARSALVAMAIEKENPQVHTVMELISSNSRVHVRSTEINEVICLGEITEKLLAQSCISPGIQHIFEHILDSDPGTSQLLLPALPQGAWGRTYREICRKALLARAPFTVFGYVQGQTPPTYVVNPRPGDRFGRDTRLECGDQLLLIAHCADAQSSLDEVLASD